MPKLTKSAPKKQKDARVKAEMHKFKKDKMHSGSKKGPKVEDRKQAIAIALSEAGESNKGEEKPSKKTRK